jgi:hypothetical protein
MKKGSKMTAEQRERVSVQLEKVRPHGPDKPTRMALCHPDRKHEAKGLCHSCYLKKWIKDHPDANTGNVWRVRNPERSRVILRKNRLKRTGCTPELYESLWIAQKGKCANRGCTFQAPLAVEDFRKGLMVDHDHITGKIRGLLCARCNTALGHSGDNTERLLGLVEYLREAT